MQLKKKTLFVKMFVFAEHNEDFVLLLKSQKLPLILSWPHSESENQLMSVSLTQYDF